MLYLLSKASHKGCNNILELERKIHVNFTQVSFEEASLFDSSFIDLIIYGDLFLFFYPKFAARFFNIKLYIDRIGIHDPRGSEIHKFSSIFH